MAYITWDTLINSHEPTILARLGRTLRLWRRRLRDRGELAQFDGRMLHDLGLTRADAQFEVSKPFWRA